MPGPQTLTDDYFSIDEEKIKQIETVLTIVNGKVVYAKYELSFALCLSRLLLPGLQSLFLGYYNSSSNVNDNTDNSSHQQEQITSAYNKDHNNVCLLNIKKI